MENSIIVLRDAFYLFSPIFAPLFALMVFLYVLPAAFKIAIKKNLVDRPNKRTSHSGKVPNLGGLSIYIGFIFSYLTFCPPNAFQEGQYIILGLTMIVFVGLYDDILISSSKTKLVAEIIIVVMVIFFGDFRFTSLHGFLGIEMLPYWISFLLTAFVAIVIINCINLSDGIDGLAAGLSFVISLFYGLYFYITSEMNLCIACFSLCGAIVPFFIYNVWGSRYKIFMGDAGSLMLGFLITIMAIRFNEMNIVSPEGNEVLFFKDNAPAISIGVLMVPLFDTLRVFCIRLINKKSPFKPDKNHLHHKLLALKFSHKQATFTLIGLNVVFIGISILLRNKGMYSILGVNFAIAIAFTFIIERVTAMHRPKTVNDSTEHDEDMVTLIDTSEEDSVPNNEEKRN